MPDVTALAEKNDIEELGRLLQLILGCAVNCDRKHGKLYRLIDQYSVNEQVNLVLHIFSFSGSCI